MFRYVTLNCGMEVQRLRGGLLINEMIEENNSQTEGGKNQMKLIKLLQ